MSGARKVALMCLTATLGLLPGCGGPDFTGGLRGNNLDMGMGGGFGSAGLRGDIGQPPPSARPQEGGVYPMVEVSFEASDVRGNPFDPVENDIKVTIVRPDQRSIRLPAFYDGETTWKVRYRPDIAGRHTVGAVSHNGKTMAVSKIEPREFTVSGRPGPGFVRVAPRQPARFIRSDGSAYYPIGMNVAWGDVIPIITKLGQAGGNWARVWMCHWGGANLDWVMNAKLESGTLDLNVAKRWDEIVDAAEKAGVYLQVVLQHHGQYSTRVNPNWSENPWNKANGGFLSAPGEFFANPRAIALTQAKYRYIIARWGHSPNVMAWELFNEVEWTDAIANRRADEVVRWHNAMAQYIRANDPYNHLVTTSSDLKIPGLWQNMSYRQPHAYPTDALAVTAAFDHAKQDRPVFYGEIGPSGLKDDGTFLHRALWSSMASLTAGAAQYWAWDAVDASSWYDRFTRAANFARESGFPSRSGLLPAPVSVTTSTNGPLTLRPGGGWAKAAKTEFTVLPGEDPKSGSEWSSVPSFLQGNAHRDMMSGLTLRVNFPEAGACSVAIAQVARAGAGLTIAVDDEVVASKMYEASARDRDVADVVTAKVPAGSHAIRIANTGADWVVVSGITLDPYAPALGCIGKSSSDYGVLWVYNRTRSPVSGKLAIAGVKPGTYEIAWFDTAKGVVLKRETATVRAKESLTLTTPPVTADLAVWFDRAASAGRKNATAASASGARNGSGPARERDADQKAPKGG